MFLVFVCFECSTMETPWRHEDPRYGSRPPGTEPSGRQGYVTTINNPTSRWMVTFVSCWCCTHFKHRPALGSARPCHPRTQADEGFISPCVLTIASAGDSVWHWAVKCFLQEMTRAISVCISLARASHVAVPDNKENRKYDSTVFPEGRRELECL